MIGEIRTFIYDLLPDPTQSALVRVERSELAISATMEATVRRIQDSMLTIGGMVEMDSGMLSPACIGMGYARAYEREKNLSGAGLEQEMYEELTSLRNNAAHTEEFTVAHLIRLRQLVLESVLPILTKKGGL